MSRNLCKPGKKERNARWTQWHCKTSIIVSKSWKEKRMLLIHKKRHGSILSIVIIALFCRNILITCCSRLQRNVHLESTSRCILCEHSSNTTSYGHPWTLDAAHRSSSSLHPHTHVQTKQISKKDLRKIEMTDLKFSE